MAKAWQDMTPDEKCEALRVDVQTIFDAVNLLRADLTRQLGASGAGFDDVYAKLKAIEERFGTH